MTLIIKFGGSVITRKSENDFPITYEKIEQKADEFIRKDVIKRLVKELHTAYQQKPFSFMVINGAGPFGHHLVHSFLDGKNVDIETIHKSVELLNSKVVEEFREFFDVISVPPFETCYYDGKSFDTKKLEKITERELKAGRVVSSYGDIVPARKGRLESFEVISGDTIAVNFGLAFKVNSIIMLTDVDGIYNKDPKLYKNAELIKKFNSNSVEISFSSNNTDVTGGMASKIKKLSLVGKNGMNVRVINGLEKNNLLKTLRGKDIGTKIEY